MKAITTLIGLTVAALSGCAHHGSTAKDNCTGRNVQVGTTVVSLDDKASAPSAISIGILNPSANRIVFKDKDGDTFTNEFSPTSGAWRTVSGMGKYSGAVASGWSRLDRMEGGGAEGPVYVATWGGRCSVR
jgi:hypothetical protein